MPGDVTLWPNLTGGEAIDILCRLSGPLDPERKQAMLERFDLDPTKKARAYSKGNRQKVALVAALASDAPSCCCSTSRPSGLDPLMEAAFTESIREVKAEGRSVLLSSHIFAEVEKLADRVDDHPRRRDGRVRHDRPAAAPHPFAGHRRPRRRRRRTGRACPACTTLAAARRPRHLRGRRRRAARRCSPRSPGCNPRSLVANPPSLEELFLRHYGDELAALAAGPER